MKISTIFTFALLFCSFINSTQVSAEDCSDNKFPKGPYKKSCSDCKLDGNKLTATCKKRDGRNRDSFLRLDRPD